MKANKRSHQRPLRGLDLNRCAGFGLCCGRYTVGLVSPLSTQSGPDLSKFSPELAQPKNSPPRKKND